jgi:hypothetical protein
MSGIAAFTQVNYIPADSVSYSTLGYGTLGFSLAGTFTSGNITVEGTVDGNTWTLLVPRKAGATLSGNLIITTGNYLVNVVGYTEVRLTLNTFVGTLNVLANVTPAFFFEGGSIMGIVSEVTAVLPLLSSGGTEPELSLSGISGLGTAGQGMFMNAGGTALEWVSSTGTGNIVRSASPTFTGTVNGAAGIFSGNIDADSFSVGGNAGASGGPFTVITSITVENGIVTDITGT